MALNLADVLTEKERLNSQEKGATSDFLTNFVRMPEGNGVVLLRLLSDATKPARKGGLYSVTRVHKVNGKSLHCPRELQDKRWIGDCPICEYYSYLWKQSERKDITDDQRDELQAKARAIKPVERYYYNAIVRQQFNDVTNQVEKNVGPKILSIGKTLHQMIVRGITGDKEMQEPALGDVTDPKTGRDFKIGKTMRQSGKDSYPNYSDSKFLDVSPAGTPEELEKWYGSLHDLNALRTLKDWEYLAKQLKIHNGVLKDEGAEGKIDPAEFERMAGDDEPVVTETAKTTVSMATATPTAKPAAAPAAPSVAIPNPDSDQPMAEEEFMKELTGMGNS